MGVGSINVWGDANRFNTLKKGANCKLLIHSDAVDETHVFTDSVGTHTPAETGNTQHDTAQYPPGRGASSILFDGVGDYLGVPDHADFDFGTGNLTIDFWVRFSAVTGIHTLYYQPGAADDRVWFFMDHATGKLCLQVVSGSVSLINQYITWVPLVSTWYHVALIRGWGGVATDWAMCVNGAAIGTFTADVTMPNLNGAVSFGGGVANTEFYDFSSVANVVTTVDSVAISTAEKKFGNASLLFGGSADYLTCVDSASWDISTSANYTIDFWMKFYDADAHGAASVFLMQDHLADPGTHWWVVMHGHGTGLGYSQNTVVAIADAAEITDTNWHHIAVVKVGTGYAMYKDGARTNSATSAVTDAVAGLLYVGEHADNTQPFHGYMADIRMSSANVFSAASPPGTTITVPTAPPVPDANTLLLLRTDLLDLAGWMSEIRVVTGTAVWTKTFKVPIGRYV